MFLDHTFPYKSCFISEFLFPAKKSERSSKLIKIKNENGHYFKYYINRKFIRECYEKYVITNWIPWIK